MSELPDPNIEAIQRWHLLRRDPADPMWCIVDELFREIDDLRSQLIDDGVE